LTVFLSFLLIICQFGENSFDAPTPKSDL
jgi:hypothetical protein